MSKHSSKEATKKNNLKIVIFIIVIVCIIAGIVVYLKKINDRAKEPEEVVNKLFMALKESNRELVNKYTDYESLIKSLDEMILENSKDEMSNVEKEMFNSIEWRIENVETLENHSTVVVEVTNKNFKNVITTWMKKVVSEKTAGNTITNELALEKLEEVLKQSSEDKKTVIKKIKLNKENETWKVEVNDDLRDFVFPGIDSVISVLNPC